MRCPLCGYVLSEQHDVCPRCGADLTHKASIRRIVISLALVVCSLLVVGLLTYWVLTWHNAQLHEHVPSAFRITPLEQVS